MKTTSHLLIAGLSSSLFVFGLAAQKPPADSSPPPPPAAEKAPPAAPEDAEESVDVGPIEEAPPPAAPPSGGTGENAQAPVPFAPTAIAGTIVYYNQADRVILLRTDDSVRVVRLEENTEITENGADVEADVLRPNVHILARLLFRQMDVIGTHIEVLQELPPGIAPASAVPPVAPLPTEASPS